MLDCIDVCTLTCPLRDTSIVVLCLAKHLGLIYKKQIFSQPILPTINIHLNCFKTLYFKCGIMVYNDNKNYNVWCSDLAGSLCN